MVPAPPLQPWVVPPVDDNGRMEYLAVLPVLDYTYADRCIESILAKDSAGDFGDNLLVVDNTRTGDARTRYGLPTYRDPDGHNLGVARAWNVGARRVVADRLDYLIIVSASMLFGPIYQTTWMRQMREFWGSRVIEATGHSWHLIALHRATFERVGLFDENFYPAYFEQVDWCRRLKLVGWERAFERVWVNALSQGAALHNQTVSCPAPPLLAYYADKWGGPKLEETHQLPWGDQPLDYWPQRTIPELAEAYNLDIWW